MDLRKGLTVTAELSAIPYKSVAIVANAKTAWDVSYNLGEGNYAQASIDAAKFLAGHTVSKYVGEFITAEQIPQATAGYLSAKMTGEVLQNDCSNCANDIYRE